MHAAVILSHFGESEVPCGARFSNSPRFSISPVSFPLISCSSGFIDILFGLDLFAVEGSAAVFGKGERALRFLFFSLCLESLQHGLACCLVLFKCLESLQHGLAYCSMLFKFLESLQHSLAYCSVLFKCLESLQHTLACCSVLFKRQFLTPTFSELGRKEQ